MDLVRAAKQGTWHTAGTQTSVPSFHYHCLPLITAVVIITMRFLRTFHFLPYPLNKWKSFLPLSVFQTVHEGLDFKTRNVRSRFKLKKELRPRLPKKGYCWDTQPFFLSSCLQKQGRRKTFFSFSSFFSKGWGASLDLSSWRHGLRLSRDQQAFLWACKPAGTTPVFCYSRALYHLPAAARVTAATGPICPPMADRHPPVPQGCGRSEFGWDAYELWLSQVHIPTYFYAPKLHTHSCNTPVGPLQLSVLSQTTILVSAHRQPLSWVFSKYSVQSL